MTSEQIKAAGEAWAQREADAVTDWDRVSCEWQAAGHDAVPLVEGDLDADEKREIAAAINQAASIEWSRLVEKVEEERANEVTDAQIRSLMKEAEKVGDEAQVQICEFALRGNNGHRRECARVIANAQAEAAS